MTTEQKAEAYDMAIEGIQEILSSGQNSIKMPRLKLRLQGIFPELAEGEGERIRKWLINLVKNHIKWLENKIREQLSNGQIYGGELDKANDSLAWLEKQGKQNPKFRIGDTIKKESTGDIVTISDIDLKNREYRLSNTGFIPFKYEYLWELVEQKPADRVEPNFKAGDWIIFTRKDGTRETLQVSDIIDDRYYFNNLLHGSWSVKECNEKCHLWTIQDAKPGDVLAINWRDDDDYWGKIIIFKKYHNKGVKGIYSMPCVEGYGNTFKNGRLVVNEEVPYYSKTWTCNLYPATKEQRDLLFQKMKEAGYEWNAEQKELKKFGQISALREEDENRIKDIIYFLNTAKKHYASTVELDNCIDWLKSLKECIIK